jgi:hypothetical protein
LVTEEQAQAARSLNLRQLLREDHRYVFKLIHKFLKAQGEKLVLGNGQEIKFWGGNIQASALFGASDENIPIQAKRIAQLGFNLMRFHHHDSDWTPNVFGANKAVSTRQLDPKMMDKIDRWIKALKDEGVYVWLDLHVGRNFLKSDGIELFDDFAKGKDKAEAKGYCYLNKSIQNLMKEFARQYLEHKNPHTEMTIKDDPAIMGILITNENDVTYHFGNGFLPDKNVPEHNNLFNEDRKKFCDASGLDFEKTFTTWLPGESKIYLNDLEHRFNMEMLDCLAKIGVNVPIATTNLWGCPAFSLPALCDGSIIDTHSYATSEELSYNPKTRPGILAYIAFGRVAGKPFAITEWNADDSPENRTDRFTLPVFVAAVSALQEWNAPMIYGYSQQELNGSGKLSSWSSFNDSALTGMMPVAALIFRGGHVSPAKKTYCLKFDRESLFFKSIYAKTCAAARTLLEQSKFEVALPAIKELPWLKETPIPKGAEIFSDPNKIFIPEGQNFVESDTKELRRDWKKGIQTINTPKSQIVSGWVGGENLNTADCEFRIKTKKAVAAVQSLDNKPLSSSAKILITLCARVEALGQWGAEPFVSEPVTGKIKIKVIEGLKVYPLKPDGSKADAISANFADGAYTVEFGKPMLSHWFIMEK